MDNKSLKFKVHVDNFLIAVFKYASTVFMLGCIMTMLMLRLLEEKIEQYDFQTIFSGIAVGLIFVFLSWHFYNNFKQLLILLFGEVIVFFNNDEIKIIEEFKDLKNTKIVKIKEVKEIVYFLDMYVIRQFDFKADEVFVKRDYELDTALFKATNLTVHTSEYPIVK